MTDDIKKKIREMATKKFITRPGGASVGTERANTERIKNLRQAYIEGAEASAKLSGWQPIATAPESKDLFEKMVDILVKVTDGPTKLVKSIRKTDCYLYRKYWYWEHLSLGSYFVGSKFKVIAWMPIPDLPKSEEV